MKWLYKISFPSILVLSALELYCCGTAPNIQVNDYVIGGYEGAAGGAVACSEVHTLFTGIPVVHYGLSECLARLVGKVYLDGAALNAMIANIDTMCTSLGSCTYQQSQALSYVKQGLTRGALVAPR